MAVKDDKSLTIHGKGGRETSTGKKGKKIRIRSQYMQAGKLKNISSAEPVLVCTDEFDMRCAIR
jgi:hypothetical protein